MGCPSCRNQLVDWERTSPPGRGFFIHKEQPGLGVSQTEEQTWNMVLISENRECSQTRLRSCQGFYNLIIIGFSDLTMRASVVAVLGSSLPGLPLSQSGGKPDVHLKAPSCLGHRAKRTAAVYTEWLTEI